MAAAARCLRSLSRSTTAAKNFSACVVKNTSQIPGWEEAPFNGSGGSLINVGSSASISSPLLKSFLSTESGLLKGPRISSRIKFSKRFAPLSFVCSIPKACPLSIDAGSEGADALDGNLGDDDGDTWSQGDDDPYSGVT